MSKSTAQDGEPGVDKEEQYEFPELRKARFSLETNHNVEQSPEKHEMLKGGNLELHKSLLVEFRTKFQNKDQESEKDEEQNNNLRVDNNNDEGITENTDSESLPCMDFQSAESPEERIHKDHVYHDSDIIGREEMRMTKWSSLKRKVKDTLSRNSYSGSYSLASDKVADESSTQKYLTYDPSKKSQKSQWYITEIPKIVITTDDQQQSLETTSPKPDQSCSIKGHDFKHDPGGVYNFSVLFDPRKHRGPNGFTGFFMSDPLKIFEGKVCLKILLNKRIEGKGYISVQLCSASESDEFVYTDFSFSHHLHRRTIIVELPSQSPLVFVDEPPFGEMLGHKWADELYWQPKTIPHKLIKTQEPVGQLSIGIHMIIEPLCPLMQNWESQDGILIWKIRNFRRNLQDERDGIKECSLSPYFYSHRQGYRMRVRLFLNGTGPARSTHMSVFLDFLAGQWDHSLPPCLTQFPHSATFAVLDQSDNEKTVNLVRIEQNNRGFGTGDFFYDFVSLADLQEDLHFRRDTMVLKVTVMPIDVQRSSKWKAPFVAPPKPPLPVRPARK